MPENWDLADLGRSASIDSLLHEPARLILMAYLCVVKRADFVFLAKHTGLSKGNLSVQMSRLSKAGYVKVEKAFVDNRPRTTYQMTTEGRKAFGAYRRQMISLLSSLPD